MSTYRDQMVMNLAKASIDADAGVLKGVTVAKAGVPAIGKFVMIDENGDRTNDPERARKRLPIVTDSSTLDTLLAAAEAGGGVFKVRSDHDDSLTARAGYASNFRRVTTTIDGQVDDVVVCDLSINNSYRDRAVVFEVATETPQLIGLSIEHTPDLVLLNDRALLRVKELAAVDIVDQGAITPSGLFLSKGAGIEDIDRNQNLMADKTPALDPDAVMSAIGHLADAHKALAETHAKNHADLSAQVAGCMSAIAEMKAVLPAPAGKGPDAGEDGMKASADKSDIAQKLSAITEEIANLKKERSALGLKADKSAAAAAPSDELKGGQDKVAPKSYIDLVKEKKAEGKLSASDIHRVVQRENPDVYHAHLLAKGVTTSVQMAKK